MQFQNYAPDVAFLTLWVGFRLTAIGLYHDLLLNMLILGALYAVQSRGSNYLSHSLNSQYPLQ